MSDFKVDFSWEEPGRARGPELRATWAQFRLVADGTCITQVVDHRVKTIREWIYLPLYPVAEWIVTHWWWLFHEMQSPARLQHNAYATRHNLQYAQEGYALPDLTILPMGSNVAVVWQACDLRERRVHFVTSGMATVNVAAFESQLTRFVEATLERLAQEGVGKTFLDEEWRAIQNSDSEERDFCRAAAQLGLDAFDLPEQDAQAMLQAVKQLPCEMRDEFFSVVTPKDLPAQAAAIGDVLDAISNSDTELPSLVALRANKPPLNPHETPWMAGYELAGYVREQRKLDGVPISKLEELRESLGITKASWEASQVPFRKDCAFIDALVAVNNAGSPGFLLEKQREDSRKFAFCRALCEFLTLDQGVSALISETRSQRQQRNRAFAAEFLAPAASLRQKIAGRTISEEGVDEIAAEFGTSPFVIRHQLENHEIAEVVPGT